VNEWKLQEKLTKLWWRKGIDFLDQRLFLAAWEVMVPSWEINNPFKKWSERSIDFLLCNRQGELWAMEVKMNIASKGESYRSLCQVVHRAARLMESYSYGKFFDASAQARSGCLQSRIPLSDPRGHDVQTVHQKFFNLPKPLAPSHFNRKPIKCIVAATEFANVWHENRSWFNKNLTTPGRIVRVLEEDYDFRSKGNNEMRRFRELLYNKKATMPVNGVYYLDLKPYVNF
jgi:hypothetical protein